MKPQRLATLAHVDSGAVLLRHVRWCATFVCRLRGMMFRRRLAPGQALLLVEPRDSRLGTAIHMLAVPFPILVVWLNSAGVIVDKVIARPWRPWYMPRSPARYVLETVPDLYDCFAIGDEVRIEVADRA